MSSMRMLAESAANPAHLVAHLTGFAGANLIVGPLCLWAFWENGPVRIPASLGALLLGAGAALLFLGARLIVRAEAAVSDY